MAGFLHCLAISSSEGSRAAVMGVGLCNDTFSEHILVSIWRSHSSARLSTNAALLAVLLMPGTGHRDPKQWTPRDKHSFEPSIGSPTASRAVRATATVLHTLHTLASISGSVASNQPSPNAVLNAMHCLHPPAHAERCYARPAATRTRKCHAPAQSHASHVGCHARKWPPPTHPSRPLATHPPIPA